MPTWSRSRTLRRTRLPRTTAVRHDQRPPIKPCVRFSRTRLSDVLPRQACARVQLHCLLLDGVYRLTDGVPIFQAIPVPTTDQLQALLTRIITRLLKALTRHGALMEEDTEIPYLADPDADPALAPLHAGRLHLPHCSWPPGRPKSADVERPIVAPRQSRGTAIPWLCECPRL